MKTNYQNILIIEDDEIDVIGIKRAFRKNNFEGLIEVAENGEIGLKILEENPKKFKIVITDINMPKVDGHEVIKHIKSSKELKIIQVFVMSTSNDENDIIKAYSNGASSYLVKSVVFSEFTDTINKLISFWNISVYPNS